MTILDSGYNQIFKLFLQIMLVGDSCCGKTCLLIRFKDGTFLNSNFISTVGIDYRNKLLELDNLKVKLQIWDTAGQERFRSITATYYRDADALLLVYDITNRESFQNVRGWLSEIQECAKESAIITLIGNKNDLSSERKVKYDEGRKLAEVGSINQNPIQAYGINFVETSAKTGQNVQHVFEEIARRLIRLSRNCKNDGFIDLAEQPSSDSCCVLL
ncbi:unnamed protein product [Dracunculus medinensis]|uniref:Ras-related protein Rab-10 n=1 Tax=Dracunculus medinensis TaxID=318479 RepID=A0A0N4U8W0_DRAME|nr:unnamed protein product [Dracunculus medinensis]